MSQINKLYRNFIILQEDERGFSIENDKTLSGYSKIEAKGEKCKISFYAQSLRIDSDDYYGLVIFNKKDAKRLVNLGPIAITEGGKAETTKEYFRDDIGGLGLSYEKISGAAIVKLRSGVPIVVMCGFINGEQPTEDWKNFNLEKENIEKKRLDRKPIEKVTENKYALRKEDKNRKSKKTEDALNNEGSLKNNKSLNNNQSLNSNQQLNNNGELLNNGKLINNEEILENEQLLNDEELLNNEKILENEQLLNTEKKYNNPFNKESLENPFNKGSLENPFKGQNNNEEYLNRGKNSTKFDSYEVEVEKAKAFTVRGSVGEYFESIADGFEVINDGFREIRYCKWYNIPVNDLNEMCNMSNYNRYTVAYYPMLNYYPYIRKYGNFRLGYKCDREGNLKYIVYGIPGKKVLEDQPYEGKTGFVTWVKDEKRAGLGCWLMFYDFRNSTVVVPME